MPMTINAPRCLHIPLLYAGDAAVIYWEGVDGAAAYKLEGSFDSPMDGGKPGRSWQHLAFGGHTWKQFDAQHQPGTRQMEWGLLDALPAQFTLFSGNTEGQLPLVYRTWGELDALRQTWNAIDGERTPASQWRNPCRAGVTQAAYAQTPPPTAPHKCCVVQIPQTARYAWFRVKAVGPLGEESNALASARLDVVTRSAVTWNLEPDDTAFLQLDGQWTRPMAGEEHRFCVFYDPAALAVDDALLWGGQAGHGAPVELKNVRNMDGKLEFQCVYPAGTGDTWSGALARVCFTARKKASTQVRVERV